MVSHSRQVIWAAVAAKGPAAGTSRRVGRPPAFVAFDFEAILPAQWPTGDRGGLQPAKRLMLAILTDAVELVLQEPAPPATRRAFLQRKAAEWMACDDTRWVFSFLNICETLGIDAKRLRELPRRRS